MSKFQIGDKVRHRNDTEAWPDRIVIATGFVRPGGYEWVVAQLCTDSPHTYNAVDLELVPVDVIHHRWIAHDGYAYGHHNSGDIGVLVVNETKKTISVSPSKAGWTVQ